MIRTTDLMAALLATALFAAPAVADTLVYAYNDHHDGYDEHHLHVLDLSTGRERVLGPKDGGIWNAVFTPSGKRLVYTLYLNDEAQIRVMDVDGGNDRQLTDVRSMSAFHPSVSPDGKSIAFSIYSEGDIGLVNMAGGEVSQIAPHEKLDYHPAFFADGERILFGSRRLEDDAGNPGIFVYHLQSGRIEHTGQFGEFARPSHDGRWLVFGAKAAKTAEPDIYIAPLDQSAPPKALTDNDHYDSQPAFSPDDSHIVFIGRGAQPADFPREKESDTEGVQEVFLISRDGGKARQLTFGGAVAWHAEIHGNEGE
ncbi:TolB family protein [Pseudomarimonas arenosa]|uniref:PD40 domain-containing protein n=1 Tax=Pseudomarimonas arenosa TaxID=2774145 RepID=A0AAW3ZJL7_9GAMM|nr:PD40 domain-containing protein [Pseudomarimonas arenosa]MBD8524651.1 PD40 domain-containing protein [Pseudomarimonas arenosa]